MSATRHWLPAVFAGLTSLTLRFFFHGSIPRALAFEAAVVPALIILDESLRLVPLVAQSFSMANSSVVRAISDVIHSWSQLRAKHHNATMDRRCSCKGDCNRRKRLRHSSARKR